MAYCNFKPLREYKCKDCPICKTLRIPIKQINLIDEDSFCSMNKITAELNKEDAGINFFETDCSRVYMEKTSINVYMQEATEGSKEKCSFYNEYKDNRNLNIIISKQNARQQEEEERRPEELKKLIDKLLKGI